LPYLAVLLYEGLIAWVGQDYLSPQAFGYLLWLGIMAIVIRWLPVPAPAPSRWRFVNATRGFLLRGRPTPADASTAMRWIALALVAVLYFAIVAAHQLTPYIALLGIAALVVLGLVWRGWLAFLLFAVIAVGFLVPHYGLISSQFGGVFSGGDVFENASGSQGILHKAAEARTGDVVPALAAGMWLGAGAAIAGGGGARGAARGVRLPPPGAGGEPLAVRTRAAGLAPDPPGRRLPRPRGRQLRR